MTLFLQFMAELRAEVRNHAPHSRQASPFEVAAAMVGAMNEATVPLLQAILAEAAKPQPIALDWELMALLMRSLAELSTPVAGPEADAIGSALPYRRRRPSPRDLRSRSVSRLPSNSPDR